MTGHPVTGRFQTFTEEIGTFIKVLGIGPLENSFRKYLQISFFEEKFRIHTVKYIPLTLYLNLL